VNASDRVLLGFDFGLRRIGVAVGQELTGTATALVTLAARDGVPDWTAVAELIAQWQPQGLVVGLPLNADGTAHAVTAAAQRFGHRLHGRYGLPVYWMDERLSSHEAAARLGNKAKTAARNIDKVAAQIILESWLNRQDSSCSTP
jgi:putative Holliday junction resolvase